MISVRPEGRLGNNLFQYVFGRIIHESTGLFYNYSLDTSIFKTPKIKGVIIEGETVYVSDYFDTGKDHLINLDDAIDVCKGKSVLIHGYFQNKSYFNNRRNDVKSWLGCIPSHNNDVTGIHIRKTDYNLINWELPNSYYEECIKKANPEKLHIFTDDKNDEYVQELIKQGGKLIQTKTDEESMFLLGTCGKQIISRSTFSWWSSFLSSPKSVYYPRPLSGWWSVKDTPNKIIEVDSSEYHYIEVK
jgi:hypothetical protein